MESLIQSSESCMSNSSSDCCRKFCCASSVAKNGSSCRKCCEVIGFIPQPAQVPSRQNATCAAAYEYLTLGRSHSDFILYITLAVKLGNLLDAHLMHKFSADRYL